MPSRWFQHALNQYNNTVDFWTADDIKASLVVGQASVAADASWQTIQDFLDNNPAASLTNQIDVAGRTAPTWASTALRFPFQNELDFGSVGNGIQIGGILLHEGANNVTTNKIYAVQEKNVIAKGAEVIWGSTPGPNNSLFMQRDFPGSRLTFQGGIRQIYASPNAWGSIIAEYQIGFALLSNNGSGQTTTMNGDENTIADVRNKGVQFITNAEPGGLAMPTAALGDRAGPGFAMDPVNWGSETFNYPLESEAGGGSPITWLSAAGLEAAVDEIIVGVLMFSFSSSNGNYQDDNQAWPWHWDQVNPHTIISGQDVRYGEISGARDLLSFIRTS